jgi:ligand-binding sensor domain-containing protein
MRILLFLLFLAFSLVSSGQNIPLYQWRSHLSYNDGKHLAEVKNKIYCATPTGLYYIDKSDNSVRGLSKVDGFSEVGIKTIGYDSRNDVLFIAYQDGGIDMLNGNTIYNEPSILNYPGSSSKDINSFYFQGDTCYMSTSLGVIEYDTRHRYPLNTYTYIDSACEPIIANSVTIQDQMIYVAAKTGVRMANRNAGILGDCGNWQYISRDSCGFLATMSGKVWGAFKGGQLRYYENNHWTLYKQMEGPVYSLQLNHGKLIFASDRMVYTLNPDMRLDSINSNQQNDAMLDKDGTLWLAKQAYGTVSVDAGGNAQFWKPGGPANINSEHLYNYKNDIWVATGSLNDQSAPTYENSGFYLYTGDYWLNYNQNTPGWQDFRDIVNIVVDSVTLHAWAASMDYGLIEVSHENIVRTYNAANSRLPSGTPHTPDAHPYGLAFDSKDNLWISTYRSDSAITVRKPDGSIHNFRDSSGRRSFMDNLVDNYDNIWMIDRVDGSDQGGIVVYNPGKSIDSAYDDHWRVLTNAIGSGALPNMEVTSMAKDRNGEIWVGTVDGVAVFPEPSLLFSKYKFDAQQVWVPNGDQSGYLLTGQTVTSIAVDGGNRKWFGTQQGVWLTNPEGDKILSHFTVANSPLVSDDIKSVTVNSVTGEVFFASDKGLVSYRDVAIKGDESGGDVYAYPNPVRPGYKGPIAIRGLVTDANVKITDVTGALVYETTAVGGQAVWDGKNFSGDEAHSGVYFVFSTNSDGSKTNITKILIVR